MVEQESKNDKQTPATFTRRLAFFLSDNRYTCAAGQILSPAFRQKIKRMLHGDKDQPKLCSLGETQNILVPNDPFWGDYIGLLEKYEPKIRALIDRFVDSNTLFIDGGANIGLWSCYAVHKTGDGKKVIAVEPGTATHDTLVANQQRHGFIVLQKALYNEAGSTVDFHEHKGHAGSSLRSGLQNEKPVRTISVTTETLDALVQSYGVNSKNIVIKLDIEGVEIEAIRGAKQMLDARRNVLIMYEDHGKDPTSKITQSILKDIGLHVYNTDGNFNTTQVNNADELRSVKKNRHKGYDFVATIPGTEFDQEMQRLMGQDMGSVQQESSTEETFFRDEHLARQSQESSRGFKE